MAAGLPVVATNVEGSRELVVDGETGLLVRDDNSNELADALEKLLLSAALRAEMGGKSREKALREFDVKRVVEQTFEAYEKLLKAC